MTGATNDQDGGPGQDAGTPPAPPVGSPGAAPGEGGGQDTTSEADLPEWARKALDKARRDAAGYRTKLRELEPLAARAAELENAGKTELERLTTDRDGLRSRADAAESLAARLQVALDQAPEHATLAQVKAVAKRVTGASDEEREADARELFALLAPQPAAAGAPAARVATGPVERLPLRGGTDPDAPPEETDPLKLAASIPRAR